MSMLRSRFKRLPAAFGLKAYGSSKWRVGLLLALWLSYLSTALFLLSLIGPAAAILSAFPVIATAWTLGIRGGLTVGILATVVNSFLLTVGTGNGLSALTLDPGNILGSLANLAVAAVVWKDKRSSNKRAREQSEDLLDANETLRLEIVGRQNVEKRLREERNLLDSLMSNVPDLIYFKDADRRFTQINTTAAKAFGLTDADDAVGKTADELLEGLSDHVRAEDVEVLRNGKSLINSESLVRFKDPERWLLTTKVRFEDDTGAIGGLIGISRDVTDRKLADEERRKLDIQVQHAQRVEGLSVLAGGIAHDFNNLLMGVIGNATLALSEVDEDSPLVESLEAIEQTGRRAADLSNQMLAYAGEGQRSVERVHLSRLVDDMTNLIEATVSKKVTIKFELADELLAIEADPAQIRQTLMNLVTNASEAVGDGMGEIAVRTGIINVDGDYLRQMYRADDLSEGEFVFVDVEDTGRGMDADTQAKIFDPFFTTNQRGRGLGLAATLGIVRAHGGAIRLESRPGEGSTFSVLFPAAGPMDDPNAASGLDSSTARPTFEASGAGAVLVADDEPTVRMVTAKMLELLGFNVFLAVDGPSAVDEFRSHLNEISLVLLDMTMPGLSGQEVFSEIRQLKADARVIIMSGYEKKDATRGLEGRGLAGFLKKPFQISDLEQQLWVSGTDLVE